MLCKERSGWEEFAIWGRKLPLYLLPAARCGSCRLSIGSHHPPSPRAAKSFNKVLPTPRGLQMIWLRPRDHGASGWRHQFEASSALQDLHLLKMHQWIGFKIKSTVMSFYCKFWFIALFLFCSFLFAPLVQYSACQRDSLLLAWQIHRNVGTWPAMSWNMSGFNSAVSPQSAEQKNAPMLNGQMPRHVKQSFLCLLLLGILIVTLLHRGKRKEKSWAASIIYEVIWIC